MKIFRALLAAVFFSAAFVPALAQAPAPFPAVGANAPAPVVIVQPSPTTVSGGNFIGEFVMLASLLLGAPLAAIAVKYLLLGLKKLGVETSDAQRQRLQEFVEHGISIGAQRAQLDLKDKLPIDLRSKVAVDALQYVQDHGAETLKQLGFDPNDPKAIEAIQARIAKAMDDKVPPPTSATVVAPATPA